MIVKVLSEALQKKLPLVNHAISSKSQLPILLNLLLTTRNGKLVLSATDLEIGIQTEVLAEIEEEGGITVPARVFSELIATLPQETITLKTVEGNLHVIGKKSKSVFQTIAQDEFPKLFEEKGLHIATVDKDVLISDFSKVLFSASLDTARPALSGILIKKEENGFLLVATDGYRLSLKHHISEGASLSGEDETLLIPARMIREVLALKHEGQTVDLYISKKNNQVIFSSNETLFIGRLLEAEFPKYDRIVPTDYSSKIGVDREELLKAVKTASIFARETANIVRFSLKNEQMVVSANTPSVGQNAIEVECSLQGEENEIAFNARYVLDALSNITETELVFEMNGPLNPGVFKVKNDDSFLHIIMPVRVQNEG